MSDRQHLKRARQNETKIENFKKRQTENMNKLPCQTTNGEDIPEAARPEILMGKTEISHMDANMIWKCKNCTYFSGNYKSMACHMMTKHRLETTQNDSRMKCPFCKKIYHSYEGLKRHIFYKNGCNAYIDLQNSASPISGPNIWHKIIECNRQPN